jgi:hypothetical protein
MTDPVRLRAQDQDDLKVISALLQDALMPLADMAYFPEERRFMLAVNRYRWEHTAERTRTHSLLSFQEVDKVLSRGLDRAKPNRMHSLLSLTFGDDEIQAAFADGGTLRLSVKALDCLLEDVGEPWPAAKTPKHDAD